MSEVKPIGKVESVVPGASSENEPQLGQQSERSAESSGEASIRRQSEQVAPDAAQESSVSVSPGIVSATNSNSAERETEKKIEKILENDLGDIYKTLPPEKKIEFKTAGEKVAHEINRMFSEAKVQVKKIIELIIVWLKIVPGLNIFFIEQEAKIKADEIMKIAGK